MNTYTVNELAKVSGYSVAYIRRLCKNGEIRAKKIGRDWIIRKSDGDAWVKKTGKSSV